VSSALQRYSKAMHYVEVAMGVILVIVGIMLFTGVFELIARFGYFVDFGI
jgi:cytochrome c-type biogenesis protein